jgi:histidinol-phosphate aminotransferase
MVIRTRAHLVYLANPDNPSGSWLNALDVGQFVSDLPLDCMLVLDEAYHEFAPAGSVLPLDAQSSRVIRLRTFSKAHGMAGARIGYAIAASDVISTFGKFRNQFEVSRVSQAGALASINDPRFVNGVIRAVEEGRREYEQLADSIGCPFIPSATNFVCIDVGGADRARAILAALLKRGVFIRMPGAPPLNRCIRLTVGAPPERAEFADILRDVTSRL